MYFYTINAQLRRHSLMRQTYTKYNLSLFTLNCHNCFDCILLIAKGTSAVSTYTDIINKTSAIPADATEVLFHRNTKHFPVSGEIPLHINPMEYVQHIN